MTTSILLQDLLSLALRVYRITGSLECAETVLGIGCQNNGYDIEQAADLLMEMAAR